MKAAWEALCKRIMEEDCSPYNGQEIVIFGAGDRGKFALFTLRDAGYTVRAFVDDDVSKHGTMFHGLPVIAPSEMHNNDFMIVAIERLELQHQIIKRFPGQYFSTIGAFIYPAQLDRLTELWDSFEDPVSKATLHQFLLAHFEQDKRRFLPVWEPEQYWITGFLNQHQHVFIDAGAYTGDTLEDFVKRTRGIFKSAYCFEPTTSLYWQVLDRARMLEKKWGLGKEKIHVILLVWVTCPPISTSTSRSLTPTVPETRSTMWQRRLGNRSESIPSTISCVGTKSPSSRLT